MSRTIEEPSFDDRTSFFNASRGLIASLDPCIIKNKIGQVVWNNEEYAFLQNDCPPTVNPKLWRQGQLTLKQGLFHVTDGIYQIRGFDISNMTLVESQSGVIVLDCLQSVECAAEALAFYRIHRGHRPVKALIYSHSHYDHFSGARGVLQKETENGDDVPIIAPEGFMEEILKEMIVAGPAMLNRAVSMFGESLPKGPRGHVGCGLGIASSKGTRSLIPPNDTVISTGETRIIDGTTMIFQMVPDTEAPSEFNVFFPTHHAIYIAECATNTMHNIVTLRGAAVRDAKRWSKQLDETLTFYGQDSDVLFSGHHWPTWGREELGKFIADQRDIYAYMHDQTVRLMNMGLTGTEIAEQLQLPPMLQKQWYAREYYGALSQNVKGIYQRYMTWFDGNPANLWRHVPVEEGKRYVSCMGGVEAVMQKAQEFVEAHDLRFAATLLDHLVAARPGNLQARDQLASVYENLAFGAENAVWRNYYLTAAQKVRTEQNAQGGGKQNAISLNPLSSVEDWFDALSIQLDGPRACALAPKSIAILIPERQETWTLRLRNGTLTYRCQAIKDPSTDSRVKPMDLKICLSKEEVYEMLSSGRMDNVKTQLEGSIDALVMVLDLCGIISTR